MHTTTSATTCAKCKHKLAPQRLLLRRRGPTTLHDDLRLATWPDESELLAPRHAAAAASSTDFSYAGQDERPRCRVDVSLPPNLSLPIDPSACRPSASLSLPSSLPLALSSLSLRSLFALTSTATTLSLSLSPSDGAAGRRKNQFPLGIRVVIFMSTDHLSSRLSAASSPSQIRNSPGARRALRTRPLIVAPPPPRTLSAGEGWRRGMVATTETMVTTMATHDVDDDDGDDDVVPPDEARRPRRRAGLPLGCPIAIVGNFSESLRDSP